MPLHSHDRLKLTTLYRFNHPIRRKSRHTETFSRGFHRLMMEAIDHYTLFLIERIEYGRLCKCHTMRCFTTFGILRMLKCCSMIGCYRLVFTEFLFNRFLLSNIIFIDILLYLSTQSDSKGLRSTADTKDRPQRIDISTTCKEKTVKMVKGVNKHILISHRRNKHWDSTRCYYLLIIDIPYRSITVYIIGSDTNYRLTLCFWESCIHLIKM